MFLQLMMIQMDLLYLKTIKKISSLNININIKIMKFDFDRFNTNLGPLKINTLIFLIAFALGMLYVYVTHPEPKIIVKGL